MLYCFLVGNRKLCGCNCLLVMCVLVIGNKGNIGKFGDVS